jgi:putative transcriptional regulator
MPDPNLNNELTIMAGSIVLSDNPPQQLKFWRKKFGIKQADLAKKMDITPSVLSDYEKGRRPSPGVNFIKRYLLALYDLAKGGQTSSADNDGRTAIHQAEHSNSVAADTVHINQPG